MHLRGLLFMLFMVGIFPVIILVSNHEIFFIIMSLILCISSIKKIHELFFPYSDKEGDEYLHKYDDEDDNEEIEELLDVDLKELKKCFALIGKLLISLFFIYCIFFVNSMFIKFIIFSIVLYNVRGIITHIGYRDYCIKISWLANLQVFMVNTCTLLTVVVVTCNKYIRSVI